MFSLKGTKEEKSVKMLLYASDIAKEVNNGGFEGLKLKQTLPETLNNIREQVLTDLCEEHDDLCVVIYCVSDKIKTPEKECDTVEIVWWENGEVSVSSCWNRVNSHEIDGLIPEIGHCYKEMLKEIYAIKHANVEIVIE